HNGILSYRRKKTGQQLFIRWESCMEDIVQRYNDKYSQYLLPIIRNEGDDPRRQYMNSLSYTNKKLKRIAELTGLCVPLTMYVARHSWASIAKKNHIPISVISEGMGHDSESTTQIYLASLDTAAIDKANRLILKLI
ncbi:MAG: tyrosine-type recombinase/integrase, partial [Bacteroidales bacterium]|nr:tyrosine-type recombinase/integrase [Bacteroidales bacterium]